MAKGILLVAFDIANAHDDEFHDWYDLEHVPERARLPGFGLCERWINASNPRQAVASYDSENWFRVPTSFDGQVMTISHTPELDSVYYAYFEPYSWERHLRLLGEVAEHPLARVSDLGTAA